jgi:hypothetical protein
MFPLSIFIKVLGICYRAQNENVDLSRPGWKSMDLDIRDVSTEFQKLNKIKDQQMSESI